MSSRASYKLFTKLPKEVARTSWLSRIRVTEAEKTQISQNAADCNLTVGDYMRHAALSLRTRSKTDALIINELRQIGEDIKGLPAICNTINRERLDALMSSVIEAISRIGQGRGGQ